MKNKNGFTIVELLIVIVVIAILATISIVAYSGIQQRANNAKTVASVNQIIKAIGGYIAINSTYPSTGSFCLVPASSGSCTLYDTTQRSTSSTLMDNLKTVSSLPTSVPDGHPTFSGITYNYSAGRTFNGNQQPLAIVYSLQGTNQNCGIPNTANNGGSTMVASSTGYTGSSSGYTYCFVSVVGP